MSMITEFKAFITRGNVIDLAVAVIIGAAFNKIVDSLVQDIIMPVVGKILGGLDFTSYYIPLNHQDPHLPLAEAKKLGAVLAYGNFLTILLNFLLLAFIIFQLIRFINWLKHNQHTEENIPSTPTEDILLLREIRDSLKTTDPT